MRKTNYIFALYVGGSREDTVSLDEDDLALARDLFLNEFGWKPRLKGKNWNIKLDSKTEEEIYND